MKLSQEIKREHGVELALEITKILNDIIEEQGHIAINDQRIWSGWLKDRSNEDWNDLLNVLADMNDMMSESQQRQIMDSVQYFVRYQTIPCCMDHDKRNKAPAWKAIMVTRELINQAQGIHLPNNSPKDESKSKRARSQFNELFAIARK